MSRSHAVRAGLALAVTCLLSTLVVTGASAETEARNHQLGDTLSEVFAITIEGAGQLSAEVSDSQGGTWTIQGATGSPHWKVVYPQVPIPILDEVEFHPQPDYSMSSADGGTVTWAGQTHHLDQDTSIDSFSCTAPLQGPQQVGQSQEFRPLVQTKGDRAYFDLPTLNAITFAANGSCSPPSASGFTGWTIDIRNFTEVFDRIPRETLFERSVIARDLSSGGPSYGRGRLYGNCTVLAGGSCTHGFSWQATMKLVKTCRSYAGSATDFSSGPFAASNSYCESGCEGANCGKEDLEFVPPIKPLGEDDGEVKVKADCYGNSACGGQISLEPAGAAAAAGKSYGSSEFKLKPTANGKIKVKLSRAARKLLKQTGFLSAKVKATLDGKVADASDKQSVSIKG